MHYHKFFDDKSEVYKSARPIYPDALIERFAELASERKLVWDCATGNGQAAVGLSKYFESVHATDVSNNQILNALGGENIEYHVEEAESSSLANESVDLITVAQALHWFKFESFWQVVDRVLKPGGSFVSWGYDWFQVNKEVDDIIEKLILRKIHPYWAPQNRILWDGYKDVGFPLKRINIEPWKLEMYWNIDQLFSYIHSWSATRRCMETEGTLFFEEAYESVSKVWGSVKQQKCVSMPLHILAGKKA